MPPRSPLAPRDFDAEDRSLQTKLKNLLAAEKDTKAAITGTRGAMLRLDAERRKAEEDAAKARKIRTDFAVDPKKSIVSLTKPLVTPTFAPNSM